MIYKVFYPDVNDCLNKYRCVVNGNEIVAIDPNFKVIRRKCQAFASRSLYVQQWYTYANGHSVLVNYWN